MLLSSFEPFNTNAGLTSSSWLQLYRPIQFDIELWTKSKRDVYCLRSMTRSCCAM